MFFFCLIFIANQTHSSTADNLVGKARQAIERIKPFKVLFVQQVFDEDQLEIEESGEIVFLDLQHLKWTYQKPDYKVFILQGDDYKFYDEENEQLTVGRVKEKNRQWIWQLLFSDELSDHITTDEKSRKIHIENDAEALDIEILLDNRFLPIKAIQHDPSGARLDYHFKEYREKIKISEDLFLLNVPQGVEVIVE